MATFLAIDQGNTKAKIVVWSKDREILHSDVFDKLTIEAIKPVIDKYEVKRASLCHSGSLDSEFFYQLRNLLDGDANTISELSQISYNIIRSYQGKLGMDRFMDYLGAVSLFPYTGMLVVDAGSALTIDVIDRKCRFRGGNISPGYVMRLDSLHLKTSALPKLSLGGHVRSFGINTESAIRSGVVMGMVAEIADSFERAKKTYKITKLILTGGDVEYLLPLLEKKRLEIYHDPYLVARGLMSYNYDVEKSPAYMSSLF